MTFCCYRDVTIAVTYLTLVNVKPSRTLVDISDTDQINDMIGIFN